MKEIKALDFLTEFNKLFPAYRYMARDRSGAIFCYTSLPKIHCIEWRNGGNCINISNLIKPSEINVIWSDNEWSKSLVRLMKEPTNSTCSFTSITFKHNIDSEEHKGYLVGLIRSHENRFVVVPDGTDSPICVPYCWIKE